MIQEKIIIEGDIKGMRFSKAMSLAYDPDQATIEESIINYYNSQVSSFEELAIERGWQDAYWTYPTYILI
ncbi:hypothetical protein [Halobacillus seohaensis]|uniref:Uncharacterized protein n=1 Tax=Halobacillus seohaensis TaxID=447421 RepID=A0ABW2EKE4_9BACI